MVTRIIEEAGSYWIEKKGFALLSLQYTAQSDAQIAMLDNLHKVHCTASIV
jgi:hypothetical protein